MENKTIFYLISVKNWPPNTMGWSAELLFRNNPGLIISVNTPSGDDGVMENEGWTLDTRYCH